MIPNSQYSDDPYNPELSEDIQLATGVTRRQHARVSINRRFFFVILIGLALAFFIIGLVIGVVASSGAESSSSATNCQPDVPNPWLTSEQIATNAKELGELIKPNDIKDILKDLTAKPHLAGTDESLNVAKYIRDYYRKLKSFQYSDLLKYDVLLSYPQRNPDKSFKTSSLEVKNSSDSVLLKYEAVSGINDSLVLPPSNGFAKNGSVSSISLGDNVTGLFYLNYGRQEDYDTLFDRVGKKFNFTDAILLIRYGKIFRGNKVSLAHKYGAKGVLLYNDPQDYGPPNSKFKPYPDSQFLPLDGVQRGSVQPGMGGDPETPGYPSIPDAFREKHYNLPPIPSLPIWATEAQKILEMLEGGLSEEKSGWKGGFKNGNYKLLAGLPKDYKVNLKVVTETKVKSIYNVISIIPGSVEPDRYVIMGNHHDAWIYGAVDPSSGTATQMAVAAALDRQCQSDKKKCPRRTMVFMHWDAEEMSLIGSTEFVEQFVKIFKERVSVYINTDISVQGTFTFRPKASFGMRDIIYNVTKNVANPNKTEVGKYKSVYDKWLYASRLDNSSVNQPKLLFLGSGSDFSSFAYKAGVQAIDLRYIDDPRLVKPGMGYPLYHTRFETFYLMDKIVDPSYSYEKAMSHIIGYLALSFSEAQILPTRPLDYKNTLEVAVERFDKTWSPAITELNLQSKLSKFKGTLKNYFKALADFDEKVEKSRVNRTINDQQRRHINDHLMFMERVFLDPLGLPGQPLLRNIVTAPGKFDSYSGTVFPGLVDILYEYRYASEKESVKEMIKAKVEKQMSALTWVLLSFCSNLEEPEYFYGSSPNIEKEM